MNERILIIDDDEKLNDLMINYFSNFGYKADAVVDPIAGMKIIEKNQHDIIVLDIMLPNMNGFEVCKKIRQNYDIPIIMLTARGEVSDRVVGLELGADDYLSKPFEPRELVARIQTILRRQNRSFEKDILKINDLEINFTERNVYLKGKILDITTMEFEILTLFVKEPGRVFNRDQIMDKIKGFECSAFDRSIDVLISRLRFKLRDDPKNPKFIKTIWGAGYSFIGHSNANN